MRDGADGQVGDGGGLSLTGGAARQPDDPVGRRIGDGGGEEDPGASPRRSCVNVPRSGSLLACRSFRLFVATTTTTTRAERITPAVIYRPRFWQDRPEIWGMSHRRCAPRQPSTPVWFPASAVVITDSRALREMVEGVRGRRHRCPVPHPHHHRERRDRADAWSTESVPATGHLGPVQEVGRRRRRRSGRFGYQRPEL